MAVRWICTAESPHLIMLAMKELPEDLSNVYEELFQRIEKDRDQNRQLAQRVISWIFAARVPLSSGEFVKAVIPGIQGFAYDITADDVLSVCHHLITYNEALDIFEFGHFSVNEFIKKRKGDEYNASSVHSCIAWTCLQIQYEKVRLIEQRRRTEEMLDDYVISVWESASMDVVDIGPSVFDSPTSDFMNFPFSESPVRSPVGSLNESIAGEPAGSSTYMETVLTGSPSTSSRNSLTEAIREDPLRSSSDVDTRGPEIVQETRRELSASTLESRLSFFGYAEQFWPFHCQESGADRSNPQSPSSWEAPLALWLNSLETLTKYEYRKLEATFLLEASSRSLDYGLRTAPKTKPETFRQWLFVVACIFGIRSAINLLLVKTPSLVNYRTTDLRTGLHIAVQWENPGTVELLLEEGALINSFDQDGGSVVSFAIHHASYIIEAGQISFRESKNVSHDMLKFLLSKGADPNGEIYEDAGPLHKAARLGYEAAAKTLLEWGANPAAKDSPLGLTAIHVAIKNGNLNIIQLLLEHDRNLANLRNWEGCTPTSYAVEYDNLDALKLLIKFQPDLNTQDRHGQTPLHKAGYHHRWEGYTQLLLAAGANIQRRDNFGWTALHCAAAKLHAEIMEVLLQRGIDPWARTNGDWSAIDLAVKATYDPTIFTDEDDGMLSIYWDAIDQYICYSEEDIDQEEQAMKLGRLRVVKDVWARHVIRTPNRRHSIDAMGSCK